MVMYSLILRDWEKGGEIGVDPTGCLRLLCPRPHQVRELMPLTYYPKFPINLVSLKLLEDCGIDWDHRKGQL